MERDKISAQERAQSLWRFMQLIEASRHQAERLEAIALRIPEQLRPSLADAAGQLRECARELHAVWQAEEPTRCRVDAQSNGVAVRQFG